MINAIFFYCRGLYHKFKQVPKYFAVTEKGSKHRGPEAVSKEKPIKPSEELLHNLWFLNTVSTAAPDKQAVVETDGSEVSQDKKPVSETDDGNSFTLSYRLVLVNESLFAASTPTSESLTKLPQASSNDEDTSTASLETLGVYRATGSPTLSLTGQNL